MTAADLLDAGRLRFGRVSGAAGRQIDAAVDRAVALTEQRRVRGAADADGRDRGPYPAAIPALIADGTGERADAALQQFENRVFAAVFLPPGEILGNPEAGVDLHGDEAAIAELELGNAFAGLGDVAGHEQHPPAAGTTRADVASSVALNSSAAPHAVKNLIMAAP